MASDARRYRRQQERNAKKLFNKIQQETLNKINSESPEERERLLLLYKHMLEEKETQRKEKENQI
jgi:hypothetical protein